MALFNPISILNRRNLIFPLSLVLFEFTTYIAHDMIQPAMLLVTSEFRVGSEWVSISLTAYLMGGILLQWLLGPLSDKFGRRPVMLSGVSFFILTCIVTHWVQNIGEFILLRLLQGSSLCFVSTVGYATIQEAFEEVLSVRIMTLMANIALLAPLTGPLVGSVFLEISDWRTMFLLFALTTSIALFGLWRNMPETSGNKQISMSLMSIIKNYLNLAKDSQIITGSLAIGLLTIPCLAWVAISPVILIQEKCLSRIEYALLQMPMFIAMILGNITLGKLISSVSIEYPLRLGAYPIITGLFLTECASHMNINIYLWINITGLSMYGFGTGLVNAVLYRLTLFSSNAPKGSVAAMLGMLSILTFIFGIELSKFAYFSYGIEAFSLVSLFSGLIWFVLIKIFLFKRKILELK